jgi:AcrR family transcriptional regulator
MSKKDQILKATIELVAEYDISKAATSKIATRANVATGTLFHHFKDKRALIHYCYLHIQEDYAWSLLGFFDLPGKSMHKHLKKAMKAALDYWLRNPNYWYFIHQVRTSSYYDASLVREISRIELSLHRAVDQAREDAMIYPYDRLLLLNLLYHSVHAIVEQIFRETDLQKKAHLRKQGLRFLRKAFLN